MKAYDFDNTIYDGETVVDFFLFCLRKKPSLCRYLPFTIYMLIRYKLGKITLSELEEKAAEYSNKIFTSIDDLQGTVKVFWDAHEHKIKSFYLMQKQSDDLIISASCGFLLREIFKRIGVNHYLCSEIDTESGKIIRLCYNTNKPEIFKEFYPETEIDEFYTDSLSDLPMIKLSKKAYLVKGDRITLINKEEIEN